MRIKIFQIVFILCLGIVAKAQLAGNYTIGPTGQDYTTIQSAVNDLYKKGVSTTVTFTITQGKFNEAIVFNGPIKGTSNKNLIIFTSNRAQGARIEGGSLNLIRLSGVSHLVFREINFFNTNASGNCILLENKVRNCRITACNFSGAKNAIQIDKNVVQSNILIDSCEFSKFSANAIRAQDCDSISINANKFFGDLNVRYAVLGFSIKNARFSNNYVNELAVQLDGRKIDFINNVGNLGETGWLNFQPIDSLRFLHNSIYSNSNSYSVLFWNQSVLQVKNNIVQNDGTGWAIEAIACKGEVFENNNFFSNDVLMRIGERFDEYSYSLIDSVNAFFNTNSNLSLDAEFDIKSTELRQMANAPIHDGGYCGVDYDYDGNVRCLLSPTIGAYELDKQFGKYTMFSELSDTLYLDQNEELMLELNLNAPDIGGGFWQIGNESLNNQTTNYELRRTKPGKEIVFLFRNKCISGDTSFRIFTILDTIKPRITIDSIQNAEQCDFFTPEYQIEENNLDTVIFGGTWTTHTLNVGEFILEINAIDNSGNMRFAKTIIRVEDNRPPILKLIGYEVDTIFYWNEYFENGVEAIDPCNETYEVETWSTTNIDTTAGTGMFTTQYWAKDSSGNVAGPITRYTIKRIVSTHFASKEDVSIYPNPSSGFIKLKLNSSNKSYRIELYQVNCKKVYDGFIKNNESLNLEGLLEDGIYLVKLSNSNDHYYSKLIFED
jgi:hypothetical protein